MGLGARPAARVVGARLAALTLGALAVALVLGVSVAGPRARLVRPPARAVRLGFARAGPAILACDLTRAILTTAAI